MEKTKREELVCGRRYGMVVRIQTYSVPMLCPGISNVLGYATLIHTETTGTDWFLVAQLTSEQINLGWQAL